MCVIALLFWLKTESNQATAAPSMNGPICWTYRTTTFVTSTLSQVTDRVYVRVCVCVCACTVYIHCYCDCTVHCTMKMSWLLLPLCLSVERSQLLHGASVYHNIISDFVSKCSVCRVCCALSIGSQVENWNWMISDHVQVCFRSQMRLWRR